MARIIGFTLKTIRSRSYQFAVSSDGVHQDGRTWMKSGADFIHFRQLAGMVEKLAVCSDEICKMACFVFDAGHIHW